MKCAPSSSGPRSAAWKCSRSASAPRAASVTRSLQPGPSTAMPGRQPRGDVVERQRQRHRTPARRPALADHADRLAARVEQRAAAVALAERRVRLDVQHAPDPRERQRDHARDAPTRRVRRARPRRRRGRRPARSSRRPGAAASRRRPRPAAAPRRARRRSARSSPARPLADAGLGHLRADDVGVGEEQLGVTKNAEPWHGARGEHDRGPPCHVGQLGVRQRARPRLDRPVRAGDRDHGQPAGRARSSAPESSGRPRTPRPANRTTAPPACNRRHAACGIDAASADGGAGVVEDARQHRRA